MSRAVFRFATDCTVTSLSLFCHHSQFNGSRLVVSHLSPSSGSSWNGSNNQSQYSIADAVKTWQHAFSKQRCSADVAPNYCKYQFNDRPKNFPSKKQKKKDTHTHGEAQEIFVGFLCDGTHLVYLWKSFDQNYCPQGENTKLFVFVFYRYIQEKRGFSVGS